MIKKSILSLICVVFILFGSNQACGMWKKPACFVGGAIGSVLAKKYFYNPIRTQIKFRKYLAPQEWQDLSNKSLETHLKTESGEALHKFVKIGFVKYLKYFRHNQVYIAPIEKAADYPLFSTNDVRANIKKSVNQLHGCSRQKGGIFISPRFAKSATPEQKKLLIMHENRHQYRGDVLKIIKTLKDAFRRERLCLLLKKNNKTEKNICQIREEISKEKEKIYQIEKETCRENMKVIFDSKDFKTFLLTIDEIKLSIWLQNHQNMYNFFRLQGFEKIAKENPRHPVTIALIEREKSYQKKFGFYMEAYQAKVREKFPCPLRPTTIKKLEKKLMFSDDEIEQIIISLNKFGLSAPEKKV